MTEQSNALEALEKIDEALKLHEDYAFDLYKLVETIKQALTQQGWKDIWEFDLKERERVVFWCKFENTIWIQVIGYMRHPAGDVAEMNFITPVPDHYGARTDLTKFYPLPKPPTQGESE